MRGLSVQGKTQDALGRAGNAVYTRMRKLKRRLWGKQGE